MLKSSIPMKTWHEWNDTQPGFLQIDLVGHEGGDNNGSFLYSCLLYTSDAADERSSVDLGGRRIIKKTTRQKHRRGGGT